MNLANGFQFRGFRWRGPRLEVCLGQKAFGQFIHLLRNALRDGLGVIEGHAGLGVSHLPLHIFRRCAAIHGDGRECTAKHLVSYLADAAGLRRRPESALQIVVVRNGGAALRSEDPRVRSYTTTPLFPYLQLRLDRFWEMDETPRPRGLRGVQTGLPECFIDAEVVRAILVPVW